MIVLKREMGHEIPGGHNYPIPGGPTVKGETVEELVDKISDYRVRNGLPVGNPMDEIITYYAEHYPWSVEEGERTHKPPIEGLDERVYAWLNAQWRNPPKELLHQEDIQKRMDTCQQCRFRCLQALAKGPASAEAARRAFLLARGNLGPDECGFCRYFGWDNRLACLLPELKPEKSAPKGCWLS
jgi:hypothetical protein